MPTDADNLSFLLANYDIIQRAHPQRYSAQLELLWGLCECVYTELY